MKNLIFTFLLLSTITFYSCKKESQQKEITITEIKFKHEGNLQLIDSVGVLKKELKIELADDNYEHQTGLMYRKHLDPDNAMLFIFKDEDIRIRSFYMKNTYIPLDIIFIDANKKIINIAKHTIPLNEKSVFSEAPAKYVLEINAGLSDILGLTQNDVIQFTKK